MVQDDAVHETVENTERMMRCPHFDTCDAPKCPLDELYDVRVKLPGDETCTLRKVDRLRLGADLPKRGLFPAEIAAYERFHGSVEAHLAAKAVEGV